MEANLKAIVTIIGKKMFANAVGFENEGVVIAAALRHTIRSSPKKVATGSVVACAPKTLGALATIFPDEASLSTFIAARSHHMFCILCDILDISSAHEECIDPQVSLYNSNPSLYGSSQTSDECVAGD